MGANAVEEATQYARHGKGGGQTKRQGNDGEHHTLTENQSMDRAELRP